MAIADGHGLPIGITVHSASPHEVKLVEDTVSSIPVKAKLQRIVGDRAYSSKPLSDRLSANFGIDLISPPKSNFKNPWHDGRKLRRYRKRWKVERLFAWLNNFWRLPVRRERQVENYFAFLLLACIRILLRSL